MRALDGTGYWRGLAQRFWQNERGWIPLAIAGVSALVSLYTSHKQADAAKQAAATQVAGAKDAQGYINQAYADAKAAYADANKALSPWLQSGAAASQTMSSLMGFAPTIGSGTGGSAMSEAPAEASATPLLSNPANDQIRQAYKTYLGREPTLDEIMSQTGKGEFGVQDPRLALSVENIRYSPEAQARATNAPQPQNQSGYTKMRGPDGSMKDIPAQYVDHYSKLGAQVIG